MAAKKKWYTKEQLIEYGFRDILYDETGNPVGYTKISETRGLKEHKCVILNYGTPYRYVNICFKYKGNYVSIQLPLHDYVWLMNDKELPPPYELDHLNKNSLDNRLSNLEAVTHKENLHRRLRCGVNQYSKN